MSEYKITKKGKTFVPTEEQEKFFEFIDNGMGNAVIKASAGSAKTSTIVSSLRYINRKKRVLCIAFNVSTRDSIKEELEMEGGYDNVTVMTFHGLGFKLLNGAYRGEEITVYEHKYKNYINTHLEDIADKEYLKRIGSLRSVYISNIRRLVDYARHYCVMKPKDIKKLTEIFSDIEILNDEAEIVFKILQWGKENMKQIDLTDMVWLPNVLNINTRFENYDYVFVDEAQDVSVAEERLVNRVKGRGCRTIAVGDEKQRINVWCGASAEAFGHFETAPNTSLFTLSTSFRLPKIGEKLIHETYPEINIKSAKNAIEGEINEEVKVGDICKDSLVLCRNTAPLIHTYLECLRMNKRCYLKGWETEKDMFTILIKCNYSKFLDKKIEKGDGLFPRLYATLLCMIDYLKSHGLSESEIYTNDAILKLHDQIQALYALSDSLTDTDELLSKIDDIFGEKDPFQDDLIVFSTIHRAKGLEADNVYILCPSLITETHADTEWQLEGERNLGYVALTRFKKSLNYIEENEWTRRILFKTKSIKRELEDIRPKLKCLIPDNAFSEVTESVKVSETEAARAPKKEKKKEKQKAGLKFAEML